MSFLPEDDQGYLRTKGLAFELQTDAAAGGSARKGLVLPGFIFDANLYSNSTGQLVRCLSCDVMVVIPTGYATTKLDSFYTIPRLLRSDGSNPNCATGEEVIFGRAWQFWSRHLTDEEWLAGTTGLEGYLQYIRAELRKG